MLGDEERQDTEGAGDSALPARRPPAELGSGALPPDRQPSSRVVSRPSAGKEMVRAALGLMIGFVGVVEGLVAAALNEVTRGTREER